MFGTRPCCADDLRPYITKYPATAQAAAAAVMSPEKAAVSDSEGDGKRAMVDAVRMPFFLLSGIVLAANGSRLLRYRLQALREVNRYKILRIAGSLPSTAELATELIAAYLKSLQIGESLQSTERRCGDDLALLAVHTLLDLFASSGMHAFYLDCFASFDLIHSFPAPE